MTIAFFSAGASMYVRSGLSARIVRVLAMRLKIAQNARDLVEVSGAKRSIR